MGITFGNNTTEHAYEVHPYANHPRRFRRIFNNFMLSKTGDNTIDGMNWSMDMRSYGMHDVFHKAGLQLPSFGMSNEVLLKYGYVDERGQDEI